MDRMHKQVEQESDERLMERYQEGDAAAFNALFTRYEGLLYNFFLRRLGHPNDCEDLYQKTFMKLHQARESYDAQRPFRPWFFTIAYNLFRDELRKRGTMKETPEEELEKRAETSSDAGDSGSAAEKRQLAERVRNAVNRLPETQRQVVLMSKFEGLDYEEISRVTGQTENGVKQMAHRAFLNLKEMLGDIAEEASR